MRRWLTTAASSGNMPLGVVDFVLSAMIRITTNPAFMASPATVTDALKFADTLRGSPAAVSVSPGDRHWSIFHTLCIETGATGNRVPHAYLASIAIEAGAGFATAGLGFRRFPGLRLVSPLTA